jgi:hypothetical protein
VVTVKKGCNAVWSRKKFTDVSEKRTTTIFRLKEHAKISEKQVSSRASHVQKTSSDRGSKSKSWIRAPWKGTQEIINGNRPIV